MFDIIILAVAFSVFLFSIFIPTRKVPTPQPGIMGYLNLIASLSSIPPLIFIANLSVLYGAAVIFASLALIILIIKSYVNKFFSRKVINTES